MDYKDLDIYVTAMENRDWQQCDIIADAFNYMKNYIEVDYLVDSKKGAFQLSSEFLNARKILGELTVRTMFSIFYYYKDIPTVVATSATLPIVKNGANISEEQIREVVSYCLPNVEYMWAAYIISVLLECDFKDSKQVAAKYLDEK